MDYPHCDECLVRRGLLDVACKMREKRLRAQTIFSVGSLMWGYLVLN